MSDNNPNEHPSKNTSELDTHRRVNESGKCSQLVTETVTENVEGREIEYEVSGGCGAQVQKEERDGKIFLKCPNCNSEYKYLPSVFES